MSWSKTVVQAEEQTRIIARAISKQKEASAFMRTNRSFRPEIDLTVAHVDFPLGLEDDIVYKWLVVELIGTGFTFRLRSPHGHLSDPFTAVVGFNLTQHDFIEVLVTNAAGVGIGTLQVGWRE